MKRALTNLYALILLTIPLFSFAQTFDWVQSIGSTSLSQIYEIETDADGNSYIGGRMLGSATLGGNTINISSNNSIILAKVDSSGNYLWSTAIDGTASIYDLAIDGSGNLYVTGNIYSIPVQFETVNINSGYWNKHFMAKYDANGNFQWIDLIDAGVNTNFGGTAISTDVNGDINLSIVYNGTFTTGGTTYTSGPGSSVLQANYDGNGNINWTSQVDFVSNQFGHMSVTDNATDANGDIYIVGNFFDGQFAIGNDTLTAPNIDSAYYYIMKCDANGTFQWGDAAMGIGYQAPSGGVTVGGSGDVYVAGVFNDSATFGNTLLTTPSGPDYFLLKYDPLGNLLWATQSGSTGEKTPSQVISNVNDEVYITGSYKQGFTLGGTTLTNPTITTNNVFILKYDPSGNPVWAQQAGESTSPYNGWGFDISNDDLGNLYLATYSGNNATFGSLTLTTNNALDLGTMARLADNSFVLPFPTDSIWPGDADYDLVADNNDLLAIGIGYGTTGNVRPNASINWVGQPNYDWTQSLASGVNYKHIDCNGDGIIDFQDTVAISQNYGLTHNKTDVTEDMGPMFYTEFLVDSAFVGDTVEVSVNLGTDTLPVNMVYGLAFTLNLDTALVDPSSVKVSYDSSWLGNFGTDMIALHKNFPADGKLDLALTRIDQNDNSGFGEIARISIIMIDDITAKTYFTESLTITISNQRVIDASEVPVSVSLGADSLTLLQEDTTGNNTSINPELNGKVVIYPNPASSQIAIEMTDLKATGYEMFDQFGRMILQKKAVFVEEKIRTDALANGIYLLIIHTDRGSVSKKVLIQRN